MENKSTEQQLKALQDKVRYYLVQDEKYWKHGKDPDVLMRVKALKRQLNDMVNHKVNQAKLDWLAQ